MSSLSANVYGISPNVSPGLLQNVQDSLNDRAAYPLTGLVTTEPRDIGAAIRGVTVARLMGETLGSVRFLRRTSEDWKYRAHGRQRAAERLKEEWRRLSVLKQHQWMRSHADYRRLEGESLALSEIADQLEKEHQVP